MTVVAELCIVVLVPIFFLISPNLGSMCGAVALMAGWLVGRIAASNEIEFV